MDSGGYKIIAIMCGRADCGMLASGIYYDADGTEVLRCTLHIPRAPAAESDTDEDTCQA